MALPLRTTLTGRSASPGLAGSSRSSRRLRLTLASPRAGRGCRGAAVAAASRAPAPAVSFTPSGLLFPYFIGAAQSLDEAGYFGPGTLFAGASGGALVSAFVLCGIEYDDMMSLMQDVGEDCRQNGTVWRLAKVVQRNLMRALPEDCHQRCSGRLTVAVSKREGGVSEMAVDHFYDKDDLVAALVATSAIPYFSVPAAGVPFRGQPCASDGGEKAFVPLPSGWAAEAADSGRPLVVCPFHISRMGFAGLALDQVDVSPDQSQPDVPLKDFLEYALQGLVIQSPSQLDNLRAMGYEDARLWAEQQQHPAAAGVAAEEASSSSLN